MQALNLDDKMLLNDRKLMLINEHDRFRVVSYTSSGGLKHREEPVK